LAVAQLPQAQGVAVGIKAGLRVLERVGAVVADTQRAQVAGVGVDNPDERGGVSRRIRRPGGLVVPCEHPAPGNQQSHEEGERKQTANHGSQ
jgi:hypothetical protein